jgi:hypothetical protein
VGPPDRQFPALVPAPGKGRLAPAPRPPQEPVAAAEAPISHALVAESPPVGLKLEHHRRHALPHTPCQQVVSQPAAEADESRF